MLHAFGVFSKSASMAMLWYAVCWITHNYVLVWGVHPKLILMAVNINECFIIKCVCKVRIYSYKMICIYTKGTVYNHNSNIPCSPKSSGATGKGVAFNQVNTLQSAELYQLVWADAVPS